MGMEVAAGMIISDYGSFPKIPYVKRTSKTSHPPIISAGTLTECNWTQRSFASWNSQGRACAEIGRSARAVHVNDCRVPRAMGSKYGVLDMYHIYIYI